MSGYRILITGGAGFLGQRMIKELLLPDTEFSLAEVRILHLGKYEGLMDPLISLIQGDIRDPDILEKACEGIDAVIHSAALVDWGTKKPKEVYDVNFLGTLHLIEACRKKGVQTLVYTSSLDAVYTGKPLRDINESQPYPDQFANMYCESKSKAEQLILATDSEELRTCAIRPADIWGEGDPYHLDALVNMAKGGFYVRLGDGSSKCQHVYVGNCAVAHVMAMKALLAGNKQVKGQVYFITDGAPENFFTFFDRIILQAGLKIWPRNLWLPKPLAYAIGTISEAIARLLRPLRYYNPKFSRFAVEYTCTDYTFSSEKALREFSYQVKYPLNDAIKSTSDYYRQAD